MLIVKKSNKSRNLTCGIKRRGMSGPQLIKYYIFRILLRQCRKGENCYYTSISLPILTFLREIFSEKLIGSLLGMEAGLFFRIKYFNHGFTKPLNFKPILEFKLTSHSFLLFIFYLYNVYVANFVSRPYLSAIG